MSFFGWVSLIVLSFLNWGMFVIFLVKYYRLPIVPDDIEDVNINSDATIS